MTGTRRTSLAKASLIALMALGSVTLWIAIPLGWLWIGSQVQSRSQSPGFGPYFLVLVGIAVSIAAMAWLLARVNRTYKRVAGEDADVRVRMPWHRSVRGEDDSRPPRSVLDVVMVISVSVALLVFGVWFFFFAGSPLPS